MYVMLHVWSYLGPESPQRGVHARAERHDANVPRLDETLEQRLQERVPKEERFIGRVEGVLHRSLHSDQEEEDGD